MSDRTIELIVEAGSSEVGGVEVSHAVQARIEAIMRADRIPGVSVAVIGADGTIWHVAGREGRYVAYHPFYVLGAAYGGLVGGVADAARLALLHLNDGAVNGTQVLAPGAAAQMRQITARGGPLDIGLGWYRPAGKASSFVEHLGGGSGFWNVIRLYPSAGLGVVVMGNTTRYHHEAVIAALSIS